MMMPEFRLGGPIDPELDALEDAVRAIRDVRAAAWSFQDPELEMDADAPSGVLEGLAEAEHHLVDVVSTLAASMAADQYIAIEGSA